MSQRSEFRIVHNEVTGEVIIKENTQFNNLKAYTVTVSEGVTTRLFGSIEKLIILKKDSKVYFHGKLNAEIQNEGGELNYFKK